MKKLKGPLLLSVSLGWNQIDYTLQDKSTYFTCL